MVERLLQDGVNSNLPRTSDDLTPLFMAMQKDHLTILNMLLSYGANPNQLYKKRSPLLAAIDQQKIEYVKSLLKTRANPNFIASNGLSPLFFAISKGLKSIVEVLLEYQADKTFRHEFELKFFCEFAKRINRTDSLNLFLNKKYARNVPSIIHLTPREIATIQGNTDIQHLLTPHASLAFNKSEPKKNDENTLDKQSCINIYELNQENVMPSESKLTYYLDGIYNKEELISYFGNLQTILDTAFWTTPSSLSFILSNYATTLWLKYNPLRKKWLLCDNSNAPTPSLALYEIADKVISAFSANVWCTFSTELWEDKPNKELLDCVINTTKIQLDLLHLHTVHAAKARLTDSNNGCWLLTAAGKGNIENVNQLLAHEADVNITLSNGITPLYIASNNGHHEVVKLLLSAGANPNLAYSCSLESLYSYAKKHGVENSLESVIKEKSITSSSISLTPRDIASIMGYSDIVNLFKNTTPKAEPHTMISPILSNISIFNLFFNQNKSQGNPGNISLDFGKSMP
jgi:ankyrin repeat protein